MTNLEKEQYVLNERFKEIYDILKSRFKVKEIIEKLKFSGSRQLYNILEDKNLVSSHALFSLVNNFNVNPTFLFLGEGNKFLDENHENEPDINFYREGKANAEEVVIRLGKHIRELENQLKQKEDIFHEVVQSYKDKLRKFEGSDAGESVKVENLEINVEDVIKKYLDK